MLYIYKKDVWLLFLFYQVNDTDCEFAERVKARIEKTTLGDVAEYIQEAFLRDEHMLIIKLDLERIKLLKIEVDAHSIAYT